MSAPPTPRYAAIYARVSTEDQGKGFSIPTQIEACQKLAEREGYNVPDTYILVDEGISGTTMDRPALMQVRELIAAKAITAVIVYDVDRLSRKMVHQLLFEEECEQAGIALLVVTDPIESGPEGALRRHIKGAFAEWEKAKISERTKRGKIYRAKRGMPLGGRVPLGYRYCNGGPKSHQGWYEVDEDAAMVVREIFRLCVEEALPTRAIAQRLTVERIPTERDRHGRRWDRTAGIEPPPPGTWNSSTVYQILTYEGYTGQGYWNKRKVVTVNGRRREQPQPREAWIPFAMPVIIPRDVFDAAQAQLARSKLQARRNRKHEYLFAGGRLLCGRCGRALTGRYDGRDGSRGYRCTSYSVYLDSDRRCRGTLLAKKVEEAVWAAVMKALEDPDCIAEGVRQYQGEAAQRRVALDRERGLVQAQLTRCERERQRWAEAYGAGVIDLSEFKHYKAEIDARQRELQEQEAQLAADATALDDEALDWEAIQEYCRRVREQITTFTMEEQGRTLEALDIRVRWTPGEPFAITGRVPLGGIVPTTS